MASFRKLKVHRPNTGGTVVELLAVKIYRPLSQKEEKEKKKNT